MVPNCSTDEDGDATGPTLLGVTERWTAADLPDQTGRTVVVTGANSGIGLAAARQLARVGAHVVLAVRDEAKGRNAATTIDGSTEVRRLDLADLASVRQFADSWSGDLDVLVNNAGVMALPEQRTADGFEMQFGTNHLGHFALTNLLLPHVVDRVVTVSSSAHRMGTIHLDDLNWERRRYRSWPAYGQSKLANLLFTQELERRLERIRLGSPGAGRPPGLRRDEPAVAHRKPGDEGDDGRGQPGGRPERRARRPPDAVRRDGRPAGRQLRGSGRVPGGPRRADAGRSQRRGVGSAVATALWLESERLTDTTFPS